MTANNNGFADMLKEMKTLLKVDEKVTLDVLEEAAEYFAKQLKPRIPKTARNKKHLIDTLKVVVKGDEVQVIFDDESWYWHLAEHGHRKRGGRGRVRGAHFVQNTWDAENEKLANMMADKIIKKME
ncbi:HK97-gp10 family putative phage morphogenesis protein [Lederbergia galactosidilytica]|uniref:HK97 gp10 family phage protein n=1 Tax=Lederbergia galactosidilytica TaxID=217031 RepID=A0A177ZXN0_9BACI|nr:HK97-gp10 family putative phage morphogenesis protein [Lederbergia galactosidilytica]OAK72687.1 HK97 gp10 family phage protein [Lederbergia galactosidilytica]